MNILVLDDDADILATEAALFAEKGQNVKAFTVANKLIDFYDSSPNSADVAVLDIILNGQKTNGIDTARQLRTRGFEGPVVFLSSSKEFGPESYEVNASGYIEKPVNAEKIDTILRIANGIVTRQKSKSEPEVIVSNGATARRIMFCDILFVEVTKNILNFHVTDGSIFAVRAPLKKYSPALLADKRFAESHRAFIVNLDYVSTVSGGEAVLLDGYKVPISKTQTKFKEKFIRYSLNRGA
ncbi:MAG: LytTR family DNA-binding domain-containing protein [Oscillospiraceae bacterium]|jgi:two-component system LytT family response regulator|nr:LytTR family DNA-binding domain-containing protein [Oscillospiraceae bacterium]